MTTTIIQAPLRRWHKAWPTYRAAIRQATALALADAGRPVTTPLVIRLSNASEVQALNRQFRKKDKPTNVLSFPHATDTDGGDMILSFETVRQEAQEQGKQFAHHALHLVVHGTLHLLHYDHETEEDAQVMEQLESQILARLGIADPYRPCL